MDIKCAGKWPTMTFPEYHYCIIFQQIIYSCRDMNGLEPLTPLSWGTLTTELHALNPIYDLLLAEPARIELASPAWQAGVITTILWLHSSGSGSRTQYCEAYEACVIYPFHSPAISSAGGGIRTPDLMLTRHLLYQLSYSSKMWYIWWLTH